MISQLFPSVLSISIKQIKCGIAYKSNWHFITCRIARIKFSISSSSYEMVVIFLLVLYCRFS
nr:MAG TPA: hypothetical protein [Caudoviricetes sp.]